MNSLVSVKLVSMFHLSTFHFLHFTTNLSTFAFFRSFANMSAGNTIECPVCGKTFSSAVITEHANSCLNGADTANKGFQSGCKRKSNDWDFFTKKRQSNTTNNAVAKSSKLRKIEKVDEKMQNDTDAVSIIDSDDELAIVNVEKEPDVKNKSPAVKSVLGHPVHQNSKKNGVGGKLSVTNTSQKELKLLNDPLADKVRPQDFDNYVGQIKAVGKNSLLHSLLEKGNNIPSMIFWGPPGCGKTTLAKIIAHKCYGRTKFVSLSATSASVGDVKQIAKVAQNDLKMLRRKTILFLDEIHRFNKLQQDALLPHVENGVITLLGATTENPSFHVNNALLSRCRVISLEKLETDELKTIIKRACKKMGVSIKTNLDTAVSKEERDHTEMSENGFEQEFYLDSNHSDNPVPIYIEESAVDVLCGLVDGDARAALNGIQMTVQARLAERTEGNLVITVENVKEGLQKSHVLYDRNGEEHYNIASALIKSMRGSDDSAALYWMTRMLEGGESPLFIARRLVVFASEDVGLADPTALNLAVSTYQACHLIGMPECGINLAHCVVFLSRAPKSVEAITAFSAAKECIKNYEGPMPSVPLHLRNAPTKLMKDMGYGKGYKYPPAFEGEVRQDYFPPSLKGTDFFSFKNKQRPKDTG